MTVIGCKRAPTPWDLFYTKLQIRRQMSYSTTLHVLPALCASAKRTSVMLLGSLWDLPRCSTQSSSRPSDDAMVSRKAQLTNDGRHHRQPRSPASSGGADSMWLDCSSCSSRSPIRSSAGEIHYARSIMPPSGAARKSWLWTSKRDQFYIRVLPTGMKALWHCRKTMTFLIVHSHRHNPHSLNKAFRNRITNDKASVAAKFATAVRKVKAFIISLSQ